MWLFIAFLILPAVPTDVVGKRVHSLAFLIATAPIRSDHKGREACYRFSSKLRHTAASWLRMAAKDIYTVAQILGHKDLRMAARYQHLSPTFLITVVNRLDNVFGALRHHTSPAKNYLKQLIDITWSRTSRFASHGSADQAPRNI